MMKPSTYRTNLIVLPDSSSYSFLLIYIWGRQKENSCSLKALIPSVIVAKVRFYHEKSKSFSPISHVGISLKVCVLQMCGAVSGGKSRWQGGSEGGVSSLERKELVSVK